MSKASKAGLSAKVLLGAVVVAAAIASPASALSVQRIQYGGTVIAIGPTPVHGDQSNYINVTRSSDKIRVSEDPNPITQVRHPIQAIAPCVNVHPSVAECPAAGVSRVSAGLANLADYFSASTLNIPVTIDGGNGTDRLYGSLAPNDVIRGGANDAPSPLQPRELLVAVGNGPDKLDGGDGDDEIDGSFGDDKLLGRAGNDWIFGRSGNDHQNGGPGNDTFQANSVIPDSGRDTILGGPGDDQVNSRDGEADLVRCMGGFGDFARHDQFDIVKSCERTAS